MQASGVLTPRTDYEEMHLASGHAQVNLDFADLFGDHAQKLQNYEGPHGYLDEVRSLFDFNVTV